MQHRRPQRDPAPRLDQAEEHRIRFASARLEHHADREHYFLDLAVRAADDESARVLELHADDAYRDAVAVATEHDLEVA